jgi:hypothetical protein
MEVNGPLRAVEFMFFPAPFVGLFCASGTSFIVGIAKQVSCERTYATIFGGGGGF